MALKSVTEEIAKLKDAQDDTTTAVKSVVDIMQAQLDMEKAKRLDEAEARLEAKKVTAQATQGNKGKGGSDKLKNPFIGFFPASRFILPAVAAIAASLVGFDDAIKALKIPDGLKSIKDGLKSVKKALKIDFKDFKLPEKFTLKMPEGLTKTLDSITEGLGKFKPSGGGLFGMLKGLGTFLDTIGGPVLKAAKFLLLPLTPFLTLIDFVVGFYKGFTGVEEEVDRFGRVRKLTTGQKLLAGLEGGILGVVKGITGAFEFLFLEIPKALLRLMGLEKVAEILDKFSLTDMVDPIWNGIKKSFMDYFGPLEDGESRLKKIFSAAYDDIVGAFKALFDFMPSFEELKSKFFSIMPDWFRTAVEKRQQAYRNSQIPEMPVDVATGGSLTRQISDKNLAKLRDAASRMASGFPQSYDPETNTFSMRRIKDGFLANPNNMYFDEASGTLTKLGAKALNKRRRDAAEDLNEIIRDIEKRGNADLLKLFFQDNQNLKGAFGNQIFATNSTSNSGNTYVGGTTNFQAAPLEAGDTFRVIPGTGGGGAGLGVY